HEQDTEDMPTRNRKLVTPGLRILRKAKPAQLDLEIEGAFQQGSSRASTSAEDTTRLDHLAFFFHGALGYTLELPWHPRILAEYDYASGDADPNDRAFGRFDTLYGARRFDFGPTGMYGAFARSNINSPGL